MNYDGSNEENIKEPTKGGLGAQILFVIYLMPFAMMLSFFMLFINASIAIHIIPAYLIFAAGWISMVLTMSIFKPSSKGESNDKN